MWNNPLIVRTLGSGGVGGRGLVAEGNKTIEKKFCAFDPRFHAQTLVPLSTTDLRLVIVSACCCPFPRMPRVHALHVLHLSRTCEMGKWCRETGKWCRETGKWCREMGKCMV